MKINFIARILSEGVGAECACAQKGISREKRKE